MNYHERIIRVPRVVGGEPIVKGTRVTLRTVLASLHEGASIAEILADFPTLTEADVRAVIALAAALPKRPIRDSAGCGLNRGRRLRCPRSRRASSKFWTR